MTRESQHSVITNIEQVYAGKGHIICPQRCEHDETSPIDLKNRYVVILVVLETK